MLRYLAKLLALPPASNLLLILLALLLWRRRPVLAAVLVITSGSSLYALSIPVVADGLRGVLEVHPATSFEQVKRFGAQAIVVLGAGRDRAAPEYAGEDTLSESALVRVRYAARLAKKSGVPVLTSGGKLPDELYPEALMMQQVLENEFGVAVRWIEGRSINTWENAQFSGDMLLSRDVRKIALVTQAWHMPRAVLFFEKRGFEVLPAPTGFYSPWTRNPVLRWVPQVDTLRESTRALHEWLGITWYRLTGLL